MPKSAADVLVNSCRSNIWFAPVGTAFPIDHATAPAAAWIETGYVHDDGISFNWTREYNTIESWNACDPLREAFLKENVEFTVPLLQWTTGNLQLAFRGGTVSVAGAGRRFDPGLTPVEQERAFMLELIDGTNIARFCFPRVQATAIDGFEAPKGKEVPMRVRFKRLAPLAGAVAPANQSWFLLTNMASVV